MSTAKDELRAEVAALREELAAERAKAELLQAQQAARQGCGCVHMTLTYPALGAAPYVPQVIYPPYTTCRTVAFGNLEQGTSGAGGVSQAYSTYTLC